MIECSLPSLNLSLVFYSINFINAVFIKRVSLYHRCVSLFLSPAPGVGSFYDHGAMAAFRVAALCGIYTAQVSSQRGAIVPVTAACRLGVAASMAGVLFGSWARVA